MHKFLSHSCSLSLYCASFKYWLLEFGHLLSQTLERIPIELLTALPPLFFPAHESEQTIRTTVATKVVRCTSCISEEGATRESTAVDRCWKCERVHEHHVCAKKHWTGVGHVYVCVCVCKSIMCVQTMTSQSPCISLISSSSEGCCFCCASKSAAACSAGAAYCLL